MAMQQEAIEDGGTYHICLAYFSGLCKGISPENMAKHMVLTYLHVLDPEDLPLKKEIQPEKMWIL